MEADSHDHTVKIQRVALVNAKEFQRACYEVVIYVPAAMQKVVETRVCLSISFFFHILQLSHMHTVGRLWLVVTQGS